MSEITKLNEAHEMANWLLKEFYYRLMELLPSHLQNEIIESLTELKIKTDKAYNTAISQAINKRRHYVKQRT